jgi:TrmH family RNA methyltransferase
MQLTSLQNPRIKYIAKLRSDSRQRRQDRLMLVEGWDEISLAQAAGHKPQTILTAAALVKRPLAVLAAETLEVSAAVFEKLSYRENPDGWIAVFAAPALELRSLRLRATPLVIVVEAVEKPGNLGAILRTCDAAGVDAVLVCDPRADLFGPNVIRASRGTVFAVPAVTVDSGEALEFLRRQGIRIAAAAPSGRISYTKEDLRGPLAVAVGTEDRGLSDVWLQEADITLKIPMRGRINSLNVSVATALILYEALRQRGE